MDIKVLLGQRVRELRLANNMTQEYLAELVGIETQSLSNIERGKYYPTAQNLNKLIEILNIEPAELFNFKHLSPYKELIDEMNKTLQQNEELTRLVYKFYSLVKK